MKKLNQLFVERSKYWTRLLTFFFIIILYCFFIYTVIHTIIMINEETIPPTLLTVFVDFIYLHFLLELEIIEDNFKSFPFWNIRQQTG